MNTKLTADDLVTENIDADITDYLGAGKWIIEIEYYTEKGMFGIKVQKCRLFARYINE